MKILTIVVIQNHYVTTEVMFSNNTLVMMLRYQKLDTHIDKLTKRDNVSQSRYQRKSDFSSKRLNEQFHGKSFIRKQMMLSVCQPVSRLLFQCFSFFCTMSYSYRKQAVIKALQVYQQSAAALYWLFLSSTASVAIDFLSISKLLLLCCRGLSQ